MSFRFGLIDGQYYITRNSAVFGKNIDAPSLLQAFLTSIYKLNKEVQAQKLILLWDSPPYIKSLAGIEEYKKDRVYACDEIVRIEKELQNPNLTQEQRETLQQDLDKNIIADKRYKVRTEVRQILLKEGADIGLPSIKIKGLEADDLAYYGSRVISENFTDEQSKSCIVSSDSDWEAFATPNCSFYRSVKNAYMVNFGDTDTKGLSPFIYRQIKDVLHGNHNNLSGNIAEVKNATLQDMIWEFKNGTMQEHYPEFFKYFDALNMDKHYDQFKEPILKAIKFSGDHNINAFFDFVRRHNIKFFPNLVKAFYKPLRPNDYQIFSL